MNRSRALVAVAVALIVGATLLSGPAIGVVDLTSPRFDAAGVGQGNATIDRVDAPAEATLERGFRSESYRLSVPDARVHVAAVDGRPMLVYRIAIDDLGYAGTSNYFLDDGDDGWQTLAIERSTLGADVESDAAYTGELAVVLRTNDGETVVYREPIAVEVTS